MASENDRKSYRFPSSRCSLWDHTTKGPSLSLHLTCQREVEISISQQVLSLAAKLSSQSKSSCLECVLIGNCLRDNKHRFVIFIERIEADNVQNNQCNIRCYGEIYIPFKIFKSTPDTKITPESCFSTMKALRNNVISLDELDLTNFLGLRAYAGCGSSKPPPKNGQVRLPSSGQGQPSTGGGLTWLEVDAILPNTCCTASQVMQIPIVPTALAKSLSSRIIEMTEYQSEFRYGFLSMDQTRKLVLFLDSDSKAYAAPLVGIWVSGVNYITDPMVWACCLRFLYCTSLTDRVCTPPQPFLLVLYSPLHAKPEFYDIKCSTVSTATGAAIRDGQTGLSSNTVAIKMDFCLCSGRGNLQAFSKSGGRGAEAFKMELVRVEQGAKRSLLDDVNKHFVQTILKQHFSDSNLPSEIFDEMVPRDPLSLSSTHRRYAPNSGPEVPEVSLIGNDSSATHDALFNQRQHTNGNPYQIIAEKVESTANQDNSCRRSSESIPRKPLPKQKPNVTGRGKSPTPPPPSLQYQQQRPSPPPLAYPQQGYMMSYQNYNMYPDTGYYPPPPHLVNWVYPGQQQQPTWVPGHAMQYDPALQQHQQHSRPSSARSQEVVRKPAMSRPTSAVSTEDHIPDDRHSQDVYPGGKTTASRPKRTLSSSQPVETSNGKNTVTAAFMEEATSLPAFNFTSERDLKMLETLILNIMQKQEAQKVTCSIGTNTSTVLSGDQSSGTEQNCKISDSEVQCDLLHGNQLISHPNQYGNENLEHRPSLHLRLADQYDQDHHNNKAEGSPELARRFPPIANPVTIRSSALASCQSLTRRQANDCSGGDLPNMSTISVRSSQSENFRTSPVGWGAVPQASIDGQQPEYFDNVGREDIAQKNKHNEKSLSSGSSEESCGVGYSKLLDNIKEFLGQNRPDTVDDLEGCQADVSALNETEFPSVAQLRCFLTENANTLNTLEYSRSGGDSTFYQPNVTLLQQRINYVSMLLDDTDCEHSVEVTSLARKYLTSVQMQLVTAENPSTIPHKSRLVKPSPQVRKLQATSNGPSPGVTQYGINMTDMSLATRRYMEKYDLIPQQETTEISSTLGNMHGLASSTPAASEFVLPSPLNKKNPHPLPSVLRQVDNSNVRVLEGYCRQPPLPVLPGTGQCQVTTTEHMFGSGLSVDEENSLKPNDCSEENRVLDLEKLKLLPKLL